MSSHPPRPPAGPAVGETTRRELAAWLDEIGRPARRLTPLAGDVSHRAYLRVEQVRGGTAILAVYPDAMRDVCRRFARTTALLTGAGIRVPRILAGDCARGRVLLEDAGDETLYERYRDDPAAAAPWIERAAAMIDVFQRLPVAQAARLNPPLDGRLLGRELEQTWELLLEPAGLAGRGDRRRRLRAALDEICARLDGAPRVACHRDFMARNLIPAGGELVVIDHQDLRPGPAAYDLASLLNDSLFAPAGLEDRLVARHLDGAADLYRRCVVQRALKACGTYAAFARRGSRRHLRLVPATLGRAARQLVRLDEGRGVEELVAGWASLPVGGLLLD